MDKKTNKRVLPGVANKSFDENIPKYRILEKLYHNGILIFTPQVFNETSIYSGTESDTDLRYEDIGHPKVCETIKEAQELIEEFYLSRLEPKVRIHTYSPKKK